MASSDELSYPERREDDLRAMGLRSEWLIEALERGQRAFDLKTANHPVTAAGYDRWSETNCALRDLLLPKGWTRLDESGLPKTVSPDGSFSLYAQRGNDDTGLPFRIPATAYPKGAAGKRDVRDNNQLDAFPEMLAAPPQHLTRTWILLYHFFEDDLRALLRSEFSLPRAYDEQGFIVAWSRRIILPTIDFTNRDVVLPDENDDEPPVRVTITKKP